MNNNYNYNNETGTSDKTFYYGDKKYIEQLKGETNYKQKKKFPFRHLIGLIVLISSSYGLYNIFSLEKIPVIITISSFFISIFILTARSILCKLAFIVSIIGMITFILFRFDIVNFSSFSTENAKKDIMKTEVTNMISKVKNDYDISFNSTSKCYNLKEINDVLTFDKTKSPFGKNYKENSYIKVRKYGAVNRIEACIIDEEGNGFFNENENTIKTQNVLIKSNKECYCKED